MYVQTVEELMTGVTSVDFVQPWYTCVPTSKSNTGMALGGIGSAITATPAGNTPFFHFYNGCGIQNEGDYSIELQNFFYGECVSSDLTLEVRSPSFFREDILAFPLFDSQGKKYFDGTEPEGKWKKILSRMVNCASFVSDNFESLSNWGFIEAEKNGTLYHSYKDKDYRYRNFAFLLNIFAFSVTRRVMYTRSLIANIDRPVRLFKDTYPCDKMLYECQYPFSITHYKEETQRCAVKKVHITPLCPGNELLSSLPLYITAFHIGNPTNQAMDVTLVLSVENFIGYDLIKTRTGVQDALMHIQRSFKNQTAEPFESTLPDKQVRGLVYRQDPSATKGDIAGELCFAVVTRDRDEVLVTTKTNYFIGSESNVVEAGVATGRVYQDIDDAVNFSNREPLCNAICISVHFEPGQFKEIEIATVIDLPNVRLGDYESQKKYTEFFPQAEGRARDIAEYFLANRENFFANEWAWRETTHHKATLDAGILSASSAGVLRQMLLDNYSFLAESTVWDTNNQFLVRECVDYPFFNSLDVYFYGSFGLLKLFPEIDNRIVRDFARSIMSEDTTDKLFGAFVRFRDDRITSNLKGVRKVLHSTPHDMGTPFDFAPNAYSWKDVALWVDLAPKFVLLVYRNFLITRDKNLLQDTWPAVTAALDYVYHKFVDGQGALPISVGYANTFDNLRGDGVCIYSASLWLASLAAAAEMAKQVDDSTYASAYANVLDAGKKQLQLSLWDEAGETYLYCVVPLTQQYFNRNLLKSQLAEQTSIIYDLLKTISVEAFYPLSEKELLAYLNQFIDNDQIAVPASAELKETNNWKDLTKIEKRMQKKRFLKQALGDLLMPDFEELVVTTECDHIFANQLCADAYLHYLGLTPLADEAQSRKVLNTILSKNMKACQRRIGASNMVNRDGSDLDSFQAQEVWLGVQYSLAASLIANGMIDEFEDLIESLFKGIYENAKIPFGVPEGFNCVGLFFAEDFIRLGINDDDEREALMKFLQKNKIVSKNNRVNFELLEDEEEFKDLWEDETNRFNKKVEADELYELLLASKLKYTAGRYFRAGMIHLLPEMLKNYKAKLDRQSEKSESFYLELVRQAKAGFELSSYLQEMTYAE